MDCSCNDSIDIVRGCSPPDRTHSLLKVGRWMCRLLAVHLAPAICRTGSVGRPGRSANRDYYWDDRCQWRCGCKVRSQTCRHISPSALFILRFHRFLSLHATGFSDRSRGRALTPADVAVHAASLYTSCSVTSGDWLTGLDHQKRPFVLTKKSNKTYLCILIETKGCYSISNKSTIFSPRNLCKSSFRILPHEILSLFRLAM